MKDQSLANRKALSVVAGFLFLFVSMSTDSSARASQTAPDKQLIVDEIKIDGNHLILTEDICRVMKTHRGDRYDREVLVQDLKAISALGYFDENALSVNPQMTSNGVSINIQVVENAPISFFSFRGNSAISTEEICKLFLDQVGKPQNFNQLLLAVERVEQSYRSKGFPLARVTDVRDKADGSIEFVISESPNNIPKPDSNGVIGYKTVRGYRSFSDLGKSRHFTNQWAMPLAPIFPDLFKPKLSI